MPTSPVKTRIPLSSFGHLVTEVKKQLYGIKSPPAPVELTGLKKHFNSYTLYGRRNCVLATYGTIAFAVLAYVAHRQNKKAIAMSSSLTPDSLTPDSLTPDSSSPSGPTPSSPTPSSSTPSSSTPSDPTPSSPTPSSSSA